MHTTTFYPLAPIFSPKNELGGGGGFFAKAFTNFFISKNKTLSTYPQFRKTQRYDHPQQKQFTCYSTISAPSEYNVREKQVFGFILNFCVEAWHDTIKNMATAKRLVFDINVI